MIGFLLPSNGIHFRRYMTVLRNYLKIVLLFQDDCIVETAEQAEMHKILSLGDLPPGRRPYGPLWAGGCEHRGEGSCLFFDSTCG
jgi:hypothetical protein